MILKTIYLFLFSSSIVAGFGDEYNLPNLAPTKNVKLNSTPKNISTSEKIESFYNIASPLIKNRLPSSNHIDYPQKKQKIKKRTPSSSNQRPIQNWKHEELIIKFDRH